MSVENSVKICHLETVMRESPRSPALLAQFISEENAHNSYPGVFQTQASDARKATGEMPSSGKIRAPSRAPGGAPADEPR